MGKLLTILILIALNTGCATQLSLIRTEQLKYNIPSSTNELHTVEIGEIVLAEKQFEIFPAIEIASEVKAGGGAFIECTIPPQVLVAEFEDEKWTYYDAYNVTDYDSWLGSNNVAGGIKIRKNLANDKNVAVFCRQNTVTLYPKAGESIEYREMLYKRPLKNQSKYSLHYNGKSEKILYFTYYRPSELGEITKSVFEFEIAESSKIILGGAEIEIVSATGTKLEYKIIKRFQQ